MHDNIPYLLDRDDYININRILPPAARISRRINNEHIVSIANKIIRNGFRSVNTWNLDKYHNFSRKIMSTKHVIDMTTIFDFVNERNIRFMPNMAKIMKEKIDELRQFVDRMKNPHLYAQNEIEYEDILRMSTPRVLDAADKLMETCDKCEYFMNKNAN
jgi:hypothetical protein